MWIALEHYKIQTAHLAFFLCLAPITAFDIPPAAAKPKPTDAITTKLIIYLFLLIYFSYSS